MKIASIVEGDGEVKALPILLRRLHEWRTPQLTSYPDIQPPIRVSRDRFLKKDEEFSRYLQLAAIKSGDSGWVLILLDADDDCPAALGQKILNQARNIIPHRAISVVLANREYEAWFIAAAKSLNGKRGFNFNPADNIDSESRRDAKGWVKKQMAHRSYGETTDQPAFTQHMNLQQAFNNSRSFRKLCSEWDAQTQSLIQSSPHKR